MQAGRPTKASIISGRASTQPTPTVARSQPDFGIVFVQLAQGLERAFSTAAAYRPVGVVEHFQHVPAMQARGNCAADFRFGVGDHQSEAFLRQTLGDELAHLAVLVADEAEQPPWAMRWTTQARTR